MKKSAVIFALSFSTALILSFQNCAKSGFQAGGDSSLDPSGMLSTSALDINSRLADSGEENGVGATPSSVSPPPREIPELQVRRELPRFIQFGEPESSIEIQVENRSSQCFAQEDGQTVCWAVVNSTEKSDRRNDPPVSMRRLDEKFAFQLDVRKGFVVSLETREVIYKLNESEFKTLREIFRNSVLTDAKKRQQTNGETGNCLMVYKSGYANLITNRNIYDLGSSKDSCSLLDLYKKPNFENSGLESFLNTLAQKFEEPEPVVDNCPPGAACERPELGAPAPSGESTTNNRN